MTESSLELPSDQAVEVDSEEAGKDLIEQAAAQVSQAMQEFQAPLLRYAAQLLRGSPESAQDVVQEAFIKYHKALRQQQSIDNLSSWLYRVTHNLAIDHYRKEKRYDTSEDAMNQAILDEPAREPSAPCRMAHKEALRLAVEELHAMTDPQRQILMLKTLKNMTLEQIGEIPGLRASTVHYHLGRALKELATRLKAKGAI